MSTCSPDAMAHAGQVSMQQLADGWGDCLQLPVQLGQY